MTTSFIYLCIQTLILWFLVIFLYRNKNKFTLIPLYSLIAVLTLLTHNLSDLGFAVTFHNWFFLISSFSYFTSVMLGVLLIYLLEGPRATRTLFMIILFISFFYIGVIGLLGLQVDTSHWVVLKFDRLKYYFWSILAMIVDVFFLAICWEITRQWKNFPTALRVFITIFAVFAIDTIIFVTGVFGNQSIYLSIIKSDIITRFSLALIITPIIVSFLRIEGFSEDKRVKSNNYFEIFNFRSDLETKIQSMEDLQKKLIDTQDLQEMALQGVNTGIMDWDVITDKIKYHKKFYELLGIQKDSNVGDIKIFDSFVHPDDREKIKPFINKNFSTNLNYDTELRLLTKNQEYKWFAVHGVTKNDQTNKPIRIVISIENIDRQKQLSLALENKVLELTRLTNVMTGRELKMVELKKEIADLKTQLHIEPFN